MRIRKKMMVTKDDFSELNGHSSLSSLDILAIVAEKVSEREGFSQPIPLHILMVERQPIVSNSKPEPSKNPDLPPAFKDEISKLGGNDPNLAIQKELYRCDVEPDHSQITMPENKSKMWLTDDEKRLLEVRDEKGRAVGFKVQVIDPGLKVRQVTFKKWSYTNTVSFVLVKQWNDIVADNRLKV